MNYPATLSPPARKIMRVFAAIFLAWGSAPVQAQAAPASAADIARSFYATLLNTMKNGPILGASGRYARLQPIVHTVFDVPFMTPLAVGPSWSSLSTAQHRQVTEAFERYITATYADRFDSYSGEKLKVAGERPLMRRNGTAWQIADVYLDGTISELAVRRSEFASILRDQGVDGLIAALNRKADLLSATVARAS